MDDSPIKNIHLVRSFPIAIVMLDYHRITDMKTRTLAQPSDEHTMPICSIPRSFEGYEAAGTRQGFLASPVG